MPPIFFWGASTKDGGDDKKCGFLVLSTHIFKGFFGSNLLGSTFSKDFEEHEAWVPQLFEPVRPLFVMGEVASDDD